MSKPTRRVKGKITINYQLTENRAERLNALISKLMTAIANAPYPHEYIAPSKGDYIKVEQHGL